MKFYVLEPEVPGNIFGPKSIVDVDPHPPKITQLDFQFDGWSGDDLLTSMGCFIVTKRLQNVLTEASLSGMSFDTMTATKSEQFEEIYPDTKLPIFAWLKVDGKAGVDDLATNKSGFRLVVSERALKVLQSLQLDNCDIEEFSEVPATV